MTTTTTIFTDPMSPKTGDEYDVAYDFYGQPDAVVAACLDELLTKGPKKPLAYDIRPGEKNISGLTPSHRVSLRFSSFKTSLPFLRWEERAGVYLKRQAAPGYVWG